MKFIGFSVLTFVLAKDFVSADKNEIDDQLMTNEFDGFNGNKADDIDVGANFDTEGYANTLSYKNSETSKRYSTGPIKNDMPVMPNTIPYDLLSPQTTSNRHPDTVCQSGYFFPTSHGILRVFKTKTVSDCKRSCRDNTNALVYSFGGLRGSFAYKCICYASQPVGHPVVHSYDGLLTGPVPKRGVAHQSCKDAFFSTRSPDASRCSSACTYIALQKNYVNAIYSFDSTPQWPHSNCLCYWTAPLHYESIQGPYNEFGSAIACHLTQPHPCEYGSECIPCVDGCPCPAPPPKPYPTEPPVQTKPPMTKTPMPEVTPTRAP